MWGYYVECSECSAHNVFVRDEVPDHPLCDSCARMHEQEYRDQLTRASNPTGH